ncbi:hypothetical protein PILCRDRAFT_812049 [Piloderma croceum F 1598]|uniref:Uncharacterized protein n=1 Tax=Piloderma croceum (strain F 1598) TaxID=765440 RepID=A0A0C3CKV7_PILCF|nr:hypothetical protein PILCRDRAFT_812049 [Piloderma croceum F 1598]
MSTVMNNDLKIRHYEVHSVKRNQDLDIVVVHFDYTVVPFKMTVGSLTSCPLDDNGESEIRAKWDGVVDHARRTNSNLVKRWLVPTGETSKLMMEAGNIVCHCDDNTDVGDDTAEIASAGRDYSLDAEGVRTSLLALPFSGT